MRPIFARSRGRHGKLLEPVLSWRSFGVVGGRQGRVVAVEMGFNGEIVSIVVHETPSLTSVGHVGVAFGLAEEEGFHVAVDLVEDGALIGFPEDGWN